MSKATEELSRLIGDFRNKHNESGFGKIKAPTEEDKEKAVELDLLD